MANTTIELGSLPVSRGAFDGSTNYYKENRVTMYGMTFRAKTGTVSSPLVGLTPVQIVDGAAVLVNTDKWELVSGNPENYNLVSLVTAAVLGEETERKAADAELDAKKANKDGYYSSLTAGAAENLVGDTEEESTFTTQMTGGEVEFGSGAGQLTKVQGNGLAWNHLVQNGDFGNGTTGWNIRRGSALVADKIVTATCTQSGEFGFNQTGTAIAGHKYYIVVRVKGDKTVLIGNGGNYHAIGASNEFTTAKYIHQANVSTLFEIIIASAAVGDNIVIDANVPVQLIDLSLIFGLGNEPATVEDAEARLAALVGEKPYYQSNAGELFGTKVLHLISYGQNLLNPANGQARLAPYSYDTIVNKYGVVAKNGTTISSVTFTPDATGVAETITPDSNGQFTISGAGTLSVAVSAGLLSDVYVWAVYDGAKDGIENYVPFQQDALEIKAGEIYGKNGQGVYEQVFPDGVMRSNGVYAGAVHDLIDLQGMTASVNVGSRAYTSGDEDDATVITDKTNTWYALATPAHYTDLKLSSDGETFRDLPTSIVVDNWGVWQQKPSEGLTPVTGHDFEGIAATISTILPMDAVEILKSVQDNGIMTSDQRAQLTNILTALQTAGIIGSFTIAEKPTNKVFPITVTAPTPAE